MEVKTSLFIIINIFHIYLISCKSILISVFEINRHGARTPKYFQERQEKLFFGSKNMQLTINGFRQEQLLGRFIRQRYVENLKFLSPEYKSEEFSLLSSPTQRTIFSAAGFLSGLYPNHILKNMYTNSVNYSSVIKNNLDKDVNSYNKRNSTIKIDNQLINIIDTEITKTEKKFLEEDKDKKSTNNNEILNNKPINFISKNIRLFSPFPDNNKTNSIDSKPILDIVNNYPNNGNTKKKKNFMNHILDLKNDDSIPQLHGFSEMEKIPLAFLNLQTKEIPLFINNPKNDRLFHGWKCLYNGKQLSDNLKNLKPIFDIKEEDILEALADFEKILEFNANEISKLNRDYQSKNNKLLVLVKFYVSYSYHFNLDHKLKINKQTCKSFKKLIINDWYSLLNANNQKEVKIPISEFFDELLNHFKQGIDHFQINSTNLEETKKNLKKENNLDEKSNKFNKSTYSKFKVFSGHDTILVNILIGLLDLRYIKDNLQKSIEDDNIFRFFVPDFGSYLIFELYYDDQGKYYYVKIIYNGIPLYDGIKILEIPEEIEKYENRIRFERFEELMKFIINKDYKKLNCDSH